MYELYELNEKNVLTDSCVSVDKKIIQNLDITIKLNKNVKNININITINLNIVLVIIKYLKKII